MKRLKIAAGSLVGAALIHLTLLACGNPRLEPGDGGFVDAALDAMGMLGDAETSDAVAQDAPTACNCPAPPSVSFSGGLDLGSGTVIPRAEFSTASATVEAYRYVDGESGPHAVASASFWLADTNLNYRVTCAVFFAGAPLAPRPSTQSTCTVSELRNGAIAWTGTGPVTEASFPVRENTRAEWVIETAAASSAGRTITVRSLRFRLSQPAGGLVTPTPAYRP